MSWSIPIPFPSLPWEAAEAASAGDTLQKEGIRRLARAVTDGVERAEPLQRLATGSRHRAAALIWTYLEGGFLSPPPRPTCSCRQGSQVQTRSMLAASCWLDKEARLLSCHGIRKGQGFFNTGYPW